MDEQGAVKPKVICVDDQEGVVAGMRVTLRKRFDVTVATSGEQALQSLRELGDVAVFITDMCMPGMSGAELLERAAEISPHTAKIVLSGQSDLDSAIRAVNAGHIFRYLKKPCAPPELREVCELASAVYERGLLERNLGRETLTAMVDLLCECLMLSTPLAFGRVGRLRTISMRLASHLGIGMIEDVGIAAGLSALGLLSVPAEILEATFHGQRLPEADRQILDLVPESSSLMLAKVPQSAHIRAAIANLRAHEEGAEPSADEAYASDDRWPHECADVIRAATAFIDLERRMSGAHAAIEQMRRNGGFEQRVLAALVSIERVRQVKVITREVGLNDLAAGMVAAQDIKTTRGTLLVARGQTLSVNVLTRLAGIPQHLITQPVFIESAMATELDAA